jgi:hypothetical protein
MSDNEDDPNENWVAISRLSSPSPSTTHHDRSTSLDHPQRSGKHPDSFLPPPHTLSKNP